MENETFYSNLCWLIHYCLQVIDKRKRYNKYLINCNWKASRYSIDRYGRDHSGSARENQQGKKILVQTNYFFFFFPIDRYKSILLKLTTLRVNSRFFSSIHFFRSTHGRQFLEKRDRIPSGIFLLSFSQNLNEGNERLYKAEFSPLSFSSDRRTMQWQFFRPQTCSLSSVGCITAKQKKNLIQESFFPNYSHARQISELYFFFSRSFAFAYTHTYTHIVEVNEDVDKQERIGWSSIRIRSTRWSKNDDWEIQLK